MLAYRREARLTAERYRPAPIVAQYERLYRSLRSGADEERVPVTGS